MKQVMHSHASESAVRQALHPLTAATVIAAYTGNMGIFKRHGVCEQTPESWRNYARDKLLGPVVADELLSRPTTVQERVKWKDLVLLADAAMQKKSAVFLSTITEEITYSINGSPPRGITQEVSLDKQSALQIFEEMQYRLTSSEHNKPKVSIGIIEKLIETLPSREVRSVGAGELLNSILAGVQLKINWMLPDIANEIETLARSVVPKN